mmetsp:Transcript_44156/g.94669  ORF Transcript_44156/g.94669 Transcript_44156/m.94669 type:complete len:375 (-) Transcript_44156:114-1238(-)|eukprot:CAMPEP_0194751838 /NCGR_PEP_ID=MMETSP0323_2-20130528/5767_1 /TAXON_ID=2866 ORGANISM="Crypthecodinium cohnii, Strain Seligo" /NCGR_SAMPLE_ID=MMETSP0323_2 /ASSEMBLY_ACC=CAM_ASM_000346 /LENGTH=374 /DNA_ID=CAMNT_0039668485 /DNA_START=55 /DNA_END=1179 /DNA_ORIENTATION=+
MSGCPFVDVVKATAPAVAPKAREIVDDFYPRMFKNNPETKAFFNPMNQFEDPPRQRMALTNAILAYATNIDQLDKLTGAVQIIAHKHCALRVEAVHYPIVHDNLMASIAHILGEAVTPEVGDGWSKAVMALAEVLIKEESKLYEEAAARPGGWRGAKDFKVSAVRDVGPDCKEVTFVKADGCQAPIEFTAGQFLTLHFTSEGATPRHYTVTSAPGQPFLQCCVKKLDKGVISNLVHNLKEGDVVGLSAPYGVFKLGERPAVLLSAGIGITPMKAFIATNKGQISYLLHTDKSEATVPFKQEIEDSGVKVDFHYTSKDGRMSADELTSKVKPYVADCDFFLCGPADWIVSTKKVLEDAGATSVSVDLFGPQLSLA